MNGTLVIAPALLLEPETAMGIVGGREIFDRMLRNQWLKPESNSGSWFVMLLRI